MTLKNASQPRSWSAASTSCLATGSVALDTESASSVSSECKRGFFECSVVVFSSQMGSMTSSEMTNRSSSTPATPLSAFISSEEAAPRRSDVLPVTTRPSGSTMAPAGAPVASAFSSAAERAGEKFVSTPTWFINSSRCSTYSW